MKRTKGIAKNDYEIIRKEIHTIFEENYRSYGYRRITAELDIRGYHVNHKLVQRLMNEEGLKCERKTKVSAEDPEKPFMTYSPRFGIIGEDLLNRNFNAERFGDIWVTDMTRIKKRDLTAYLTVIIDMFNGEVVGYDISENADLKTILKTVRFAHYKQPECRPILHSDRGWFYCATYYVNLLNSLGYLRSMSSSGNCLDNAAAETFFALLKKELIYPNDWDDLKSLKRDIHKYIKYYNTKRIKKSLGYLTPVEYRLKAENSVDGDVNK